MLASFKARFDYKTMNTIPIATPLTIRMHANDNVVIVANDGGLPPGTLLPEGVPGAGIVLAERVPQGHKLALEDIAEGAMIRRYNVPIGYALKALPAGSWVHERLLRTPLLFETMEPRVLLSGDPLSAAVQTALKSVDRQGLAEFPVLEGTIGADARALGAASLPLFDNFIINRNVLFKEMD